MIHAASAHWWFPTKLKTDQMPSKPKNFLSLPKLIPAQRDEKPMYLSYIWKIERGKNMWLFAHTRASSQHNNQQWMRRSVSLPCGLETTELTQCVLFEALRGTALHPCRALRRKATEKNILAGLTARLKYCGITDWRTGVNFGWYGWASPKNHILCKILHDSFRGLSRFVLSPFPSSNIYLKASKSGWTYPLSAKWKLPLSLYVIVCVLRTVQTWTIDARRRVWPWMGGTLSAQDTRKFASVHR